MTSNAAAFGDDVASTGEVLVCGASVDELLEQVAEGHATERTNHQQNCVHCSAALAELTEVWAPVLQLAEEHVVANPGLRIAIRRQIDRLVDDTWYTLQLTDHGEVRVAARIVATIARDAASRVPGVRAALGRSTEAKAAQLVARATRAHRHPRAAVGVLGRTAVVDLTLAVQYGHNVRQIALTVQRQVIETLRRDIGLKTVRVNVTVDDVLPPKR